MSRVKRSVFLSLLVLGTILSLVVTLPAQVGRRQGMIEPNIAMKKTL